jgi:hypothetical protein
MPENHQEYKTALNVGVGLALCVIVEFAFRMRYLLQSKYEWSVIVWPTIALVALFAAIIGLTQLAGHIAADQDGKRTTRWSPALIIAIVVCMYFAASVNAMIMLR